MNTLFAKLSIALLLIVSCMGTAFFILDRINTRAYYDELSQRLNAPIAMYVTQQRQLLSNGVERDAQKNIEARKVLGGGGPAEPEVRGNGVARAGHGPAVGQQRKALP